VSSELTPIAPGEGPAWNVRDSQREGPLAPYVRAIRSHVPLVIAIWLAVIAGSVGGVVLRTEVYEASAQLLVTPVPAEDRSFLGLPVVRESGDPTRTLQTAATLADSHEAGAEAARQIGGDWTAEKVMDAIEVQPLGESSILAVEAQTDDPKGAALLANMFASSVIDVRSRELRRAARVAILETRAQLAEPNLPAGVAEDLSRRLSDLRSVREGTDPTLSISEEASVPLASQNAPPWLVVLLGVLAGGVLATGAALILELFTPQAVLNEGELLSIYPLPVLARLPAMPRRRWRRLFPPSAPYAGEAYRFVQAQLELGAGSPRAVLFTSPSRGDGKTTTIVGFARELAGAGRMTILMDLDLRSPRLATALGVELTRDITAALTGRNRLAPALTAVPRTPNLKLAGAVPGDGGAMLERAGRVMPQLLDEGRRSADYVLIDTPPLGEVSDALQVMDAVDDVVIVVRLGNTRPGHLRTMRELLERMGRTVSGYIVIGAEGPGADAYRYAAQRPARPEPPARVEAPRLARSGAPADRDPATRLRGAGGPDDRA
jgi:Mrp family chromosome partitioning ATPase/capsular polysaccharide biosynthesis protein